MIYFYDALMSTGKSSYMINWINSHPEKKFVVAAITLSEAQRYADECNLPTPLDWIESNTSKSTSFLKSLKKGESIVITHALFLKMTDEHLKQIEKHGYILVMDEVISGAISPINLSPDDISTLREKSISIEENGLVNWLKPKNHKSSHSGFTELKEVALDKRAYFVGNCYIVSILNTDLFTCFAESYILTYLAKYSLLYLLFQSRGIPADILFFDKNGNHKQMQTIKYSGKIFKDLIEIDDGNTRNSGKLSLSRTGWGNLSSNELVKISKDINGYLHAKGAPIKEVMWTTFLSDSVKLLSVKKTRPKFNKKNFLQHTARGTNDYSNRKYLVYALDKYAHPGIIAYLNKYGIQFRKSEKSMLEQDYWRLGEMLQWIWRSAIRKTEPQKIYIYIPSKQMKKLLEDWLKA